MRGKNDARKTVSFSKLQLMHCNEIVNFKHLSHNSNHIEMNPFDDKNFIFQQYM